MNNSEGQTQEPVGGMKSKEEILNRCRPSGTHIDYTQIYKAMEEYAKQFTPPPSPVGIDAEQAAFNWQKENEKFMPDEQSESMLYESFMAGVEWKSKQVQPESSTSVDEDRINILIDELKRVHQQYGYESAANAIAEYHSYFNDPNFPVSNGSAVNL